MRKETRRADRDETFRLANRAEVSGWNDHDRMMFFLYAMPWFLFAEVVILAGIWKLVPMGGFAHEVILAMLLPFNVVLYWWYRILVSGPGALLQGLLGGRQELALDGMSQARSHEMKGAYDLAAEEYRGILAVSPARQDARMALAALYRFRMNAPDRAVAEYLAAARGAGDPGPAAVALLEAATLLKQAGNAAGAERTLQELLDRFPAEGAAKGARRLLGLLRTG